MLVATDRLSAFDRILCAVPFKGEVLTRTARHWFEATGDLCPNHVLAYPDPNVVVARRLDILPVEMVVRGYLAGTTGTSVLTLYKAGQRDMYGPALPDGMRDNQRLPAPILTPTARNSTAAMMRRWRRRRSSRRGCSPRRKWEEVSALSLALFARGQAMAAERGLILADTKYEFGTDADGRIVLADEIHTPDSSRYWRAASYEARFAAGARPGEFRQGFRPRLGRGALRPISRRDSADPGLADPGHRRGLYRGLRDDHRPVLHPARPGEDVLARVRRNLAPFSNGL